MAQNIITHTVIRRDFDGLGCPECGGETGTCVSVHEEPGGAFHQCYVCGTYFAVVDDCFPPGTKVKFERCEGAPVTLRVERHPFEA